MRKWYLIQLDIVKAYAFQAFVKTLCIEYKIQPNDKDFCFAVNLNKEENRICDKFVRNLEKTVVGGKR